MEPLRFLVSAPRGLSDLLARELVGMGAADARERSTGVTFSGDLAIAYRACLWSRMANRVFLELARFDVADAEAFYTAVREIDWTQHIGPGATLACDFSGHHPAITHTHFGALKLKDAIVVDSVRDACAWRPSVELERPSVQACMRMLMAHRSRFRWIFPERACIAVVTEALRVRRPGKKMSRRECSCAQGGRSSQRKERSFSIRCVARGRSSSRRR